MGTLYIIRGLPGSGKSTYAKTLEAVHVENDMYLMQSNSSDLDQAQQWCNNTVRDSMEKGYDVAVSNILAKRSEMTQYCTLAMKYRYRIVLVECKHNYGSVHKLTPEEAINMRHHWEEIPEEWYDERIVI